MNEAMLGLFQRMRDEADGPEAFAFRVLNSLPGEAESIEELQERTSMQLAALIRYLYDQGILSADQVSGALFEMAQARGM